MNKNIIYYLALVIAFAITGCSEETDPSFLTNSQGVLVTAPASVMTDETAGVVTINFELDENQIVNTDLIITVDQENSTALLGTDFLFEDGIHVSVPAYVRSGSFDIEVIQDGFPEGMESVKFDIVSDVTSAPLAQVTGSIDVQIADYIDVDSILNFLFFWEKEVTLNSPIVTQYIVDIDGQTTDTVGNPTDTIFGTVVDSIVTGGEPTVLNTCVYMDFDFYFAALGTTVPIGALAETAACPEGIGLLPQTFELLFGANLWGNGFVDEGWTGTVDVPITTNVTKAGFFVEEITTTGFTTQSIATPATLGSFLPLCIVKADGNIYTISLPNGTQVVMGRQAFDLDEFIELLDAKPSTK